MKCKRWQLLFAGALTLMPAVLSSCAGKPDAQSLCAQAQTLLQFQRAAVAQSLLEKAVAKVGFAAQSEAERAALLTCLGDVYLQERQLPQSQASFQEACDIYARKLGPQCAQLALPLLGLAEINERDKKYAESEKLARQALLLLDKHAAQSAAPKQIAAYNTQVEKALSAVIGVACRSGRCRDEVELYQRLLPLRTKIFGRYNQQTSAARLMLAEAYVHQRRYQEALPLCLESVKIDRLTRSHELPTALDNLAHVLDISGDAQSALPLIQQSLQLRLKNPDSYLPQLTLGTLRIKGQILFDMGRFAEAQANDAALLTKAKQTYGENSSRLADYYVALADTLAKQGKIAQARATQAQAERLYRAQGAS